MLTPIRRAILIGSQAPKRNFLPGAENRYLVQKKMDAANGSRNVTEITKTLLFLFLLTFLSYKSQSQQKVVKNMPLTKKVECPQLQISFLLPSGFTSLDDAEIERLSKKGQKAIKEEFDNDQALGWQKGCINLRDSLKRIIIMNHISVKEAISQNGSVKIFIEKTFDDANEFLIRRIATKLGAEFKKNDVVSQSIINIAGYQVRKDAVTIIKDNYLLMLARYYFFEKNGRLYLLSFTAGNAIDNQQIEKAIESAIKM